MAGDASYPNVSLSLHYAGANLSTTFTDTSPTPKTLTAVSGAKISTAQSKFGGSAGLFNGSTDYLTTPSHAAFQFGTGLFSLDTFAYFAALPGSGVSMSLLQKGYVGGTNLEYAFSVLNTAGVYTIVLSLSTNGTAITTRASSAIALTATTWHHFEVCRDSTTIYFFFNGALVSSVADTTNIFAGAGVQSVAANPVGSGAFNGYLEETRVTKGVCRHTATFTPAVAANPDYAGQISGVVRDAAAALVARTVRAYDRTTGALTNSTTSSAVDGTYSMNFLTLDEMSVLCLDDAGGSLENDFVARVIPA
jgi:hypothetical protein